MRFPTVPPWIVSVVLLANSEGAQPPAPERADLQKQGNVPSS